MILTTKGRYAVMAMIDIAYYGKDKKAIALHEISARQDIALNYLEQIFSKLKKHNLVRAIKGPGGGYVLDKKPEEISVLSVMNAVEESMKITRCTSASEQGCLSVTKSMCFTHALWNGLENEISNYLGNISLFDVCNKLKK